jgi:hypothetical protein
MRFPLQCNNFLQESRSVQPQANKSSVFALRPMKGQRTISPAEIPSQCGCLMRQNAGLGSSQALALINFFYVVRSQ